MNNSSIVFTSSLAGLGYGTVGNSMYSASKGAISSFVRVASKEFASRRIRVNAVCPGMVKTDIMSKGGVSDSQLAEDEKNYYQKLYTIPADVIDENIKDLDISDDGEEKTIKVILSLLKI